MAKKKVKVVQCPQLKPYIETLELKWKIEYKEGKMGFMQIGSDPSKKIHHIFLPKADFHLPDGVYELGHAALTERVDIQLSSAFFSHKYHQLRNEPQRHFKEMCKWFVLCWGAVVDVWANDLVNQFWPELIIQGINDLNEKCEMVEEAGQTAIFSEWNIAIGLALHMGEIRRFGLYLERNRIFELLLQFDTESQNILTRLSRLLASLPRLTYEREADLKTLEEAVQAVNKILNFPINPRLVEENGRMVWELD